MQINILKVLLVFSITFSGLGATPAISDNNASFAKFLFGAAALVALSQPNVRNHHVTYSVSSRRTTPAPKQIWHYKEILPADCNLLIRTGYGKVRIAPNRCLQNYYDYVKSLPQRCQRSVEKLNGHILRGYKVRCLQRYGYSFQW